MKRRIFLFAALAVLAISALGLCFFPLSAWKDVFLMPFCRKEPVAFTILPGELAGDVAKNLVKSGIAADKDNLIRYMTCFSMDRNIRPGIYRICPGPTWKVMGQIRDLEPEDFKVTIIPGTPLDEFFPSDEAVSQDRMLKSLESPFFPKDMVPFLPENPSFRAVFLLPETYRLPEFTPERLVTRASKEWWNIFKKNVTSSKDLLETAIVASLVEMESRKDLERPVIAGVIMNRLNKGMALQIDATVVYSWKTAGRKIKRVLHDDLKIRHPYNTYVNKGLPPGPICIPSAPSWEAAWSPAKHRYLFYVADGSDGHIFSRTFDEHRRAVSAVRGR